MVFTAVGRVDLLEFCRPLLISPGVRREHARKSSDSAERHLDVCIRQGLVKVQHASGSHRVAALAQRHRALSPVDLSGLAWAVDTHALLLADDQDLVSAAAFNGIQAFDVPAVVEALRENGMPRAELRALAFEIEWTARRPFKTFHRRRFGLE